MKNPLGKQAAIASLFRRFGVDIGLDLHRGWNPKRLASVVGRPDVVIDIGVADGTPDLYAAFPDAEYILVEPLAEFAPQLTELLRTELRGELHQTALGSTIGEVELHVNRSNLLQTSSRTVLIGESDQSDLESRTVPLTTLDTLLADRADFGEMVVKIDVEGNEIEVLRGAERVLGAAKYVIAEVGFRERHDGAAAFPEIHEVLSAKNFELVDVLHVQHPKSLPATFMDAMYQKKS
jgi:FkbM family methyltransferase